MHDYELTERGKIVIAVLVVLPVLVLAVILAISAFARQPDKLPDKQDSETTGAPPSSVATPPPVIKESPPPDGGGFTPPEITPPETAPSNGEDSPAEQEPSPPPAPGPTGGDPSEGTLSFLFSPDLQSVLDAETFILLDEFLKSPKNTGDSLIAVEMPQLPDGNAEKLISAVTSAFDAWGIPERRLAYIMQSGEIVEGAFEVHLFFILHDAK